MQPRYDEVWQDGSFLESAVDEIFKWSDSDDVSQLLEDLKGLKSRIYRGEVCIQCGMTIAAVGPMVSIPTRTPEEPGSITAG